MTILEKNIYNTLLAIEEEKVLEKTEPTHALVIKDNLQERVETQMGQTMTWNEFYKALQSLANDGYIHLGDTIRDQFAKVIYREITSKL